MIPFFSWTTISLGPLTLQVWGIMVSLGILMGTWVAARYAQQKGLSKDFVYQASFWIIISAFIGARIFHVVFYYPQVYAENIIETLYFWNGGFSVIGGFLGAIVGYTLLVKKEKIPWMKYADALMYGLPLGLGCGRIGCFLIHDHPGTLTHSPLGVQQPDGSIRHDHGLYLSINGFILAFVFFLLNKQPRGKGFYLQVFLIWYGSVRFVLDFYRINDITYFFLTPAQFVSVLMIVGGVTWVLLTRIKKSSIDDSLAGSTEN